MQTTHITAPFGRRPMTLAVVKRQIAVSEIKEGKAVDKWKVFRDATAARDRLGLQDRGLTLLDALLSFYPEQELRQGAQMVVFPSNEQLALRAHGMAGSTLRRHIGMLVEAGLIVRKDSANGKRFARKSRAGEIDEAYGFDLAPLLLRSEELARIAQEVTAEKMALRRVKERLTICRRDVRKLISAALEEGAAGDWEHVEDVYLGIVRAIPRKLELDVATDICEQLAMLRDEIINILEFQDNSAESSTNAIQIEQHVQNSNTECSAESEPSSGKEQGKNLVPKPTMDRSSRLKAFPLGVVLKACPDVVDYCPGGQIANWRDLMAAAVVVRSTLGISPSAYQEACEVMGPENAGVAVACILERAGHINSPGGYLRDLTRKAARGEFALGPMLMALLKAQGVDTDRRAG